MDTLWTLRTFQIFSVELCARTSKPSPKFSPSCWDGRPLQQNWPSLRHSPACVHKEAHQQNVGPRISAFANLSACQLLRSQLPTSGLSDVDQGSFHSCIGHSIRQKLFRAAISSFLIRDCNSQDPPASACFVSTAPTAPPGKRLWVAARPHHGTAIAVVAGRRRPTVPAAGLRP